MGTDSLGARLRDGRKAEREPSSRWGLPQTAYSVLHMYGHLAKKHMLLAGGRGERRSKRSVREADPSSCPQRSMGGKGAPEHIAGEGSRRKCCLFQVVDASP